MNKQYVEDALNKIRPFYDEVAAHIDTMKVGDKVPATKLAEQIAERHGLTGPQLYPTLKFLFDTCPELVVKRGAHGGLFKIDPNVPEETKDADTTVQEV
jgi:hypothetical protein